MWHWEQAKSPTKFVVADPSGRIGEAGADVVPPSGLPALFRPVHWGVADGAVTTGETGLDDGFRAHPAARSSRTADAQTASRQARTVPGLLLAEWHAEGSKGNDMAGDLSAEGTNTIDLSAKKRQKKKEIGDATPL